MRLHDIGPNPNGKSLHFTAKSHWLRSETQTRESLLTWGIRSIPAQESVHQINAKVLFAREHGIPKHKQNKSKSRV